MKCEDLNEALVDLVDGRLDGAEQRSVERHLEGCANCRALVEDLRTFAPRRSCSIGASRRPRRGRRCRPRSPRNPRRRAACSTCGCGRRSLGGRELAGVAGRGGGVDPGDGDRAAAADESRRAGARRHRAATDAAEPTPEVTVESVTAEFEAAEKHYQKAIDDLQTHRQQGHRRARSAGRRGAAEEPDGDRSGDHREPRRAASRSRRAPTRRTGCSTRCARRWRCCSRPSN